LRQSRLRLIQWVEDVRSVGGEQQLTVAVEGLAHRLSALTAQRNRAAEISAIADELAKMVVGTSSTGTSNVPGAPVEHAPAPVRTPFWK